MITITDRIINTGILPVIVIENASDAVPLANALLKGKIDIMEITLRSDAAYDAISNISRNIPLMLVGAGTVLTVEQARLAVEAGASFIVSPGTNVELIKWCQINTIPCFPGCATPTEIMTVLSLGIKTVKFFPADIYGGKSALKALSAPFRDISFLPTGGVNMENLSSYVSLPSVAAVGGSFIATKQDISNHDFNKITELAIKATNIIEESRRGDIS